MNDEEVFSSTLTLPYSAVNANGRVKADWLLNVFQDAAFRQCYGLGISGFDMAKKQLKWVVAQYKIQIHNHVKLMTPLTLNTWRAPWKNLYEVRQFTLSPDQGPPMVTATSIWILIKADSGRPVRLTPNMPSKLMQATAEKPDLIRPSKEFGQFHHETCFPVRFLDLDLNQHVNNRIYLRWAVESLPEPYCFEYAPVQCNVVYRKEGLFGDDIIGRIRLEFSGSGLISDHAFLNRSTREELARLNLVWEKNIQKDIFARYDT